MKKVLVISTLFVSSSVFASSPYLLEPNDHYERMQYEYWANQNATDFVEISFDEALASSSEEAKDWLLARSKAVSPLHLYESIDSQIEFLCKHLFDAGSLLITAIQYNNLEIVKLLVEHGIDVNWISESKEITFGLGEYYSYWETPLLTAAQNDNYEIVKYLLDNGAIVNDDRDINGNTALLIAIRNENADIVSELIDHGANVNTKNKKFETPLIVASQSGNESVVNCLLDHGAKLRDNKDVNLADAVKDNYFLVAKYLIDNGSDVNEIYKDKETPLAKAIGKENPALVKYLTEHGADINQPYGNSLDTPLHDAVIFGNKDIVKYLVKKGAYVNAKNQKGETPINLAEEFYDMSSPIVQILYSPGAKRI